MDTFHVNLSCITGMEQITDATQPKFISSDNIR